MLTQRRANHIARQLKTGQIPFRRPSIVIIQRPEEEKPHFELTEDFFARTSALSDIEAIADHDTALDRLNGIMDAINERLEKIAGLEVRV